MPALRASISYEASVPRPTAAATECRAFAALPIITNRCRWPQHAIDFSAKFIQLFLQHRISRDRVAPDFLIYVRGHVGEICNVRLQAGLAVANRLSQQFRARRDRAIC